MRRGRQSVLRALWLVIVTGGVAACNASRGPSGPTRDADVPIPMRDRAVLRAEKSL